MWLYIPANVKHWHGAAADSWMSHVAFRNPGTDCANEWCEPVTDGRSTPPCNFRRALDQAHREPSARIHSRKRRSLFARRWGTLRAPSFSRDRATLAHLPPNSHCCSFARARRACRGGGGCCGFRPGRSTPDEAYLGYFDWKTLGCLSACWSVASALGHGRFRRAARAVIARFRSPGLSRWPRAHDGRAPCVATNDMALIMMLPLSAATLIGAGHARLVAPVFVATVPGSEPMRHDHCPSATRRTCYLYLTMGCTSAFSCATMALPFALSTAGVVACTWWLCGPLGLQ